MVPRDLHKLAEMATSGFLNSLLAGIALALLAWAVTSLFGRRGAGTRFAVWFSSLVAITILPIVWQLGATHGYSSSGDPRGVVALPATTAVYLFLAWLVGATLGMLRVCLSLFRLRQLRSTCLPVDPSQFGSTFQASLAAIESRRRVTVCSSNAVRVPAAIGYFRPIVVFPAWTLQEVPAAELDPILLHELAHLRRYDDWSNLAQKVLKAVFFFHPAVWFIEGRLTLEREMACDDAVLAANFSPRSYAESLLGLAEKSFLHRGIELAQAAVSHVQQLKARIVEILRRDREGSGRVWKPAIALMTMAGILSIYGVSRGPQLFAFAGDGTPTASSAASNNINSLRGVDTLHPVNVSFVGPAPGTSRASHVTSATRLGIVLHLQPKPSVALAQHEVPHQFVEDDLAAAPVLVPANFRTANPNMLPSAVLVVMQSEQFGIDGPVFWRITVVHLTPTQQRAITGGIPKRI